MIDPNQMATIQQKLRDSLKVIQMYKWLLDSYVLDFYIDKHWEKMPNSWMNVLSNVKPEQLTDLLIPPEQNVEKIVWPLSLLALRKVLQRLCISRTPQKSNSNQIKCTNRSNIENGNDLHIPTSPFDRSDANNNPTADNAFRVDCLTHPKIRPVLMAKNIKLKKRHEIERMGQLTAKLAKQSGIKYIVDFGSGLGHLARLLAYGYGLNVCCIEKEIALTKQANELDSKMVNLVLRVCQNGSGFERPVHLNMCLSKETSFSDLVQRIRSCFNLDSNDTSFAFGIIGLHPCGDLASILIDFFLKSAEAKFLNLVGCCYFKITIDQNPSKNGYPLSTFLLNKSDVRLSFEAREIACHAIEVYADRLAQKNYDNLRVHSFRAAIEKIICKYWPERRHSGLRSIKRLTTFREYCDQAVRHINEIQIPEHEITSSDTETNLNDWKLVVIFYTLRLMVAPIVESVILYDRLLCLLEHGCETKIDAIFDPIISARNHITTAVRS